MLNVTIQNDGKIKIQSECSNTKENRLNIPLERAKAIVNTAVNDKHNDILLSQSSDSNFLTTIRDALESVGCICQITES